MPTTAPSFLARMSELIKGGLPSIRQELRYPRPDGRLMHGETTIALIRNETGEIEQLIVQIVDMTDKQEIARVAAAGAEDGGHRPADRRPRA